ncbi:ABC transporter ATP-binding protein [Agaribacterium sp. ZY112]|uniref:ABC transporter ATP-binding protein n=1 Tax=Agaribacterium sp. ZY112 TaxID=3233574 RepID=UPI003525A08E
MLTVKNLKIHFKNRKTINVAVDDISFSLSRGETLAIVGESGSGKSISCYSLLGLVPCPPGDISSGTAVFEGEDLLSLNERQLRDIRGAKISMIFQDPMTCLTPHMRIGEQVAEALKAHQSLSNKEAQKLAIDALHEVGIVNPEQRYKDYPHQFSGGMRQRVMIAMALATQPEILIADEPTTALDVTVQKQILELLAQIQQQRQLSIIFISHDLAVVKTVADRILVMQKGCIVEQGLSRDVLKHAKHPYTQTLLDAVPSSSKPQQFVREKGGVIVDIKSLRVNFAVAKSALFAPKVDDFRAVDNVSFEIHEGEILGLVGESGSGKSTIGKCLTRLCKPSSGSVYYKGDDLCRASASSLQREIQMVFQDPFASLNPRMTVFQTLSEPLLVHGLAAKAELHDRIRKLLSDVELDESAMGRYPHEFSGGQRQRIAIARALACEPRLLVADEPVSALDVTVQKQILALLLNLAKEHQLSMLFISHDLAVVRYVCDRVLVLKHGELVEQGACEDLFSAASHSYTQQLIASIPEL